MSTHRRRPNDGNPAEATTQTEPLPFLLHPQRSVFARLGINSFLQAMQQCGFVLSTVDVEKGQLTARNFRSTIGCYQELEFVSSHMFSGFNEVEVSFVAEAQQTHIMLEIDRTFRSDQLLTMTISNQNLDVNQITLQIRRLLQIA